MVYLSRVSRIGILLGAVLLLGASCNVSFKTGPQDGGVYFSSDGGETWTQHVFVNEVKGKKVTIDNVSVRRVVMDPRDSRILYLALEKNGLWWSQFEGERWTQILNSTSVQDVVVDWKNTNRLFVALSNQILVSQDRGKKWDLLYQENLTGIQFMTLRQSPVDASLLLLGLSDGRLLVSRDGGVRWTKQSNFNQNIRSILPSIYDINRFYVATNIRIYRTNDGGFSWDDITKQLAKDHPEIMNGIARAQYQPGGSINSEMILFSSPSGFAYTLNAGGEWIVPRLTLPSGSVAIASVTVDPKNHARLYYATQGALYRTNDGGTTWQFFPLPFRRVPTNLMVDWYASKNMYIGTWQQQK